MSVDEREAKPLLRAKSRKTLDKGYSLKALRLQGDPEGGQKVQSDIGATRRLRNCGRPMGDVSVTGYQAGRSHVTGVETCGSVHACPVCAPIIASERAEEIKQVLRRHWAAGGHAYHLTLTHPHERDNDLRAERSALAMAWQKVVAGAPWLRAKEALGFVGFVRAFEVSHGWLHGWHSHLHIIFLTTTELGTEPQAGEHFRLVNHDEVTGEPLPPTETGLKAWLWQRWGSRCKKLGLGAPDWQHGVRIERINPGSREDYLVKFGLESELTKAYLKEGRGGMHRTPWQILADGDAELWLAYCVATKGARQLTWSVGLRARYGLGAEVSDSDLAKAAPDDEPVFVVAIPPGLWPFDDPRRQCRIEDAVASGDLGALDALLGAGAYRLQYCDPVPKVPLGLYPAQGAPVQLQTKLRTMLFAKE